MSVGAVSASRATEDTAGQGANALGICFKEDIAMQIEKNITLFAGAEPDYAHMAKAGKDAGKDDKESKTIFAGGFLGNMTIQERVQQRKAQAQKEALKIVRDAWAGDQAIDQMMDESRERIRQLQEENRNTLAELNRVEEQRQELMETYGVNEDTPMEQWPEEYKSRMQELDDYAQYHKMILDKNKQDIIGENAAIRGIKQEKLKRDPQHTMIGASQQADEILEAASDEIIGMVMEDAKAHLDEEQEKREEKAEKLKEKKEEMEELQEKREENQEAMEELIEEIPVDEMLKLDQIKTDIQQEVQNIVDKMKLVAEDIKGSMVDTNV